MRAALDIGWFVSFMHRPPLPATPISRQHPLIQDVIHVTSQYLVEGPRKPRPRYPVKWHEPGTSQK
jgi:hypothetical protein